MIGRLHAVLSLTALFGLLVLFYGPWQSYCVALARQRMFEVRDALFDIADNGEIGFNSAEYRAMRTAIENIIRFAHDISWPRMVIFLIMAKARGKMGNVPTLRASVEMISDAVLKEKATGLLVKLGKAVATVLFLRSLPLVIALGLALLIRTVYRPSRGFFRHCVAVVADIIQRDAETAEGDQLVRRHAA